MAQATDKACREGQKALGGRGGVISLIKVDTANPMLMSKPRTCGQ